MCPQKSQFVGPARNETELLARLLDSAEPGAEVVVPNGDDAAVVRFGGELVAVTTDTVVGGRHFDAAISSPSDVGFKAIEAAASDIVAMGGKPRHVYIALSTPPNYEFAQLSELYRGIHRATRRLGAFVLGGDTTVGTGELVVTITVVGVIQSEVHLSTRSGARPGDLVCLSGPVGGAAAGLLAYRRNLSGFEGIKALHRLPECRLDLVDAVAPFATAMIDISDGLSSEIHHLCRMSGVGAKIVAESIPFDPETTQLAELLGVDRLSLALSGGDDYQLLYTLRAADRGVVSGAVIGEITESGRVLLERSGITEELPHTGYDHIASSPAGGPGGI